MCTYSTVLYVIHELADQVAIVLGGCGCTVHINNYNNSVYMIFTNYKFRGRLKFLPEQFVQNFHEFDNFYFCNQFYGTKKLQKS